TSPSARRGVLWHLSKVLCRNPRRTTHKPVAGGNRPPGICPRRADAWRGRSLRAAPTNGPAVEALERLAAGEHKLIPRGVSRWIKQRLPAWYRCGFGFLSVKKYLETDLGLRARDSPRRRPGEPSKPRGSPFAPGRRSGSIARRKRKAPRGRDDERRLPA